MGDGERDAQKRQKQTITRITIYQFLLDIHNKNMNVKNETEADEHTEDLNCSVEVSMSIIAPNSIGKKTISTKSADNEGKYYL